MNNHDSSDNLEIRPHHLLCMKQFGGRGYSEPFTENMKRIRSAVLAGNRFFIARKNDAICGCCPNAVERTSCTSEEKVRRMDTAVMALLGIQEKEYTATETDLILRNNLTEERFENICGDCEWKKVGVCSWKLLQANL